MALVKLVVLVFAPFYVTDIDIAFIWPPPKWNKSLNILKVWQSYISPWFDSMKVIKKLKYCAPRSMFEPASFVLHSLVVNIFHITLWSGLVTLVSELGTVLILVFVFLEKCRGQKKIFVQLWWQKNMFVWKLMINDGIFLE